MFKEKDFIELEYTGILKSNNAIFDTTNENLAKANNIYNPKMAYGPIVICLGENHILKGLDEELIGKDTGEYEIELSPEKAFGKKNPKLLMLISASKFKKENIRPVPGMQINVDNQLATIKSVNGGRVLVDFNHPLAGQTVIYKIKVLRKVEDLKEKVEAELAMLFNAKVKAEVDENKAIIKLNIPDELKKQVEEKLKEVIPEIKEILFSDKKETKEKV